MSKWFILGAAFLVSACGGPVAPSISDPSWLAGTWRGTLELVVDGQPPVTGQTVWTWTARPGADGFSYDVRLDSTHPWFAAHVPPVVASVEPPGTAPATVHVTGLYPSPRGCSGSFYSIPTALPTQLSGSFGGVDCGVAFVGSVTLTR